MGTIDSRVIGYEIRDGDHTNILYDEYNGYHPSSLLNSWWYFYDNLGYKLDLVEIIEERNVKETNYERKI